MKKNVMAKNIRQTILKSLGRYLAIVAIIALGAGMFSGMLITKTDMVATAQKYTDEQNMFDLRLLNTYGWSADDVQRIAHMAGVSDAEGSITLDVIAGQGQGADNAVYRLYSIPEKVNKVYLLGGRMPEKPDECLVDGSNVDDSIIGQEFVISQENDSDTLDSLSHTTFRIVGYVNTPLYMDLTRGSTTIGNGSLSSFVYISEDAFCVDYYSEIGVTMQGDYEVYTDAFTTAMENMADAMESDVTVLAQDRYIQLKADAETEYADGLREYEDGVAEFEQKKQDALDELAAALKELEDGQAEIDANWITLLDGEQQLADAQILLDDNKAALVQSRQELANQKAETYAQLAVAQTELITNYKMVISGSREVENGLTQIESGITQLVDGLTQIDDGIAQVDLMIGILNTSISLTEDLLDTAKKLPTANPDRITQLEDQLTSQQTKYNEYTAKRQELTDMQTEYTAQLDDLRQQKTELTAKKVELDAAMQEIELGMLELESSQTQADNQFAAAEAQLEAGALELEEALVELSAKKDELASGRAELESAQAELDSGMAEYENAKAEAEKEFAQAETELLEAKMKLQNARSDIDAMADPDVYLLNRNTNIGYVAVNSNSDIVAGVSRVFPVFFLLVAALVCITTMTRMVDEERTQIGILKALGYSNGAIVWKYLFYSGSAAVIGCGVGVVVGSVVFPKVLWVAYGLMLNLTPDIVLEMNWPLCITVVAAYTAVSMLVTWYCCRRELREVPAELMRPKAPTAGKKILLEYLPFWNKISFLNKVMFRNVFRYRQRLLMMLMGICGCTSLLLSGFGFRDSIAEVVTYQYDEITVYDIEVYFAEGQTLEQQEQFRDKLQGDVENILFYHRSSVELDHGNETREINLIATDEKIREFIDLHQGKEQLGMPGVGEAYLTIGVAEAMGISEGDTVTLRNSDMKTLTVEITGIYDNYVHNYVIIRPETIQAQWNETPKQQMAFINVGETQDVHSAGAIISGMDGVMNVAISQDIAEQIGVMMEALQLVVITIVICAGMLAVIVLYNLTNISITERVREIATIKVLGFNAKETAAYVFKENLLLTAMGTVAGLGGGVLLLKFVMSQVKIDMVWFADRLTLPSYIWAVILTMLSAVFVDFLLYFKLEKINMAEALKSVE